MSRPAGVVEHLFRHSAGRIVATLARALGPERLDLAEEAVADALEQALRTWPRCGIPDNPRGWLFRAARNRAMDVVRREQALRALLPRLVELDGYEADRRTDDELVLMLLCCHPALPMVSQVALTLKTVGGLGVNEIAAALLTKPATVAQRLVRAKKWLRASGKPLSLPGPDALESRVDSVLAVLYLLFNEGYDATAGEVAVRGELCGEAIRLGRLLLAEPKTDLPRVRALVALMLLQGSRLPARVDRDGDLLLLDEQDRDRWDKAAIEEGVALVTRALSHGPAGPYQVRAAIAAVHGEASTAEATDWREILGLYDVLVRLVPGPVERLGRAIAVAMVWGPRAGLTELDALEGELRTGHRLDAVRGHLLERAGSYDEARAAYESAAAKTLSLPEQRYLRARAARLSP